MHHGLDRKMQEDWIQSCEDEGLPEPSHPAVTIGKGVDEFELVVENAAPNQQVVL